MFGFDVRALKKTATCHARQDAHITKLMANGLNTKIVDIFGTKTTEWFFGFYFCRKNFLMINPKFLSTPIIQMIGGTAFKLNKFNCLHEHSITVSDKTNWTSFDIKLNFSRNFIRIKKTQTEGTKMIKCPVLVNNWRSLKTKWIKFFRWNFTQFDKNQ